jgi:ribosomal protein S18 acetylase RimI-like enzyme
LYPPAAEKKLRRGLQTGEGKMNYRKGNSNDLKALKNLAIKSWRQFQNELTPENWKKLENNLSNDKTYIDLLENSYNIICINDSEEIIGMSFLVPKGNPTDLFDKDWCYIRYVTVDPNYCGQGIGRHLTEKLIQYAKDNGEKTIALHTSEMMNKARHIYESLGFTILKEIEPRFDKKYWIYTLEVNPKRVLHPLVVKKHLFSRKGLSLSQ